MATKTEVLEILRTSELRELLASASVTNARGLVELDLIRRIGEIELELSSATAARDEAVANSRAADDRFKLRLQAGWQPTLFGLSLLALGLILVAAAASLLFGWSVGRSVLTSWRSPFHAGWLTAMVWFAFYALVALVVIEALFFTLMRFPTRRRSVYLEEQLADLHAAVDHAEAARRKELIALVRNHVTEILNSSQGPEFKTSLVVRSELSSGKPEHVTLAVGLSEVTNEDNRVATDVQERLVQLLTTLPGAAIGISGPRGVGKSTLLAALCSANPTIDGRPAIAIYTAAPVEYDGREFLLHLFSSLCRQVLRTEGQWDAIREDQAASMTALTWPHISHVWDLEPIARLLAFCGIGLVAAALALSMMQAFAADDLVASTQARVPAATETSAATPSQTPFHGQAPAQPTPLPSSASSRLAGGTPQAAIPVHSSPTPTPSSASVPTPAEIDAPSSFSAILRAVMSTPWFKLGVVALFLSMMTTIYVVIEHLRHQHEFEFARYRRRYYRGDHSRLVTRAVEELRNIGFQRSYTSGWSGTLKIPIGLDIASSGGLTLAQRPESLPELVERFRGFVSAVTRAYDNVVLIGIDELDKLKSAQQAEAFLNGVKSVFGIPRCFYLISVSEHALAAFERRGIAFRDAFDSALDDIVQIDFLSLKQSRLLLNRRILRLPDPFLQLCYMLSGGLPRDLIRQARALLDCAVQAPSGSFSLVTAVEQMAARDLTARVRATSIAMRTVKEITETSDLLVKVASLPSKVDIEGAEAALASFRAYLVGLSRLRDSGEGRVLLRFADELAVYYETMILSRRVAVFLSTRKGWDRATDLGLAEQVARVRQALEVGVPLAEVRLAQLRKAVGDAAVELESEVGCHACLHEHGEAEQHG